jgi:dTDP-4-amino-4,6-dideoxygalactose transaminase
VIEDACQAWGAEWQGERVGALGDLGAFSFQTGKNITAGEGGAVVTNDPELHERVLVAAQRGADARRRRGTSTRLLGLNLRMTEWQGAVLLAQFERLEEQYPLREKQCPVLDPGAR